MFLTKKRVLKIISKSLDLDENKINLNSEIEDLTRDSIQLFELVIALEKEFGYQAKYEDLIKIITVGDIIEYIKKIEK
ncbi:acyl carrier protein [Patescibacteria group bacterium]|nr:acyl carrier protein [Patescibacteria group bacterium]MBU4082743.1 acyl carrier protein [Patescibacteria group bacterium]MBU4141905.1 acyl carrier protein [Patescibacteria group bacterium]